MSRNIPQMSDPDPDPDPETESSSLSGQKVATQTIWHTPLHSPPYHVGLIGCRSGRVQNQGADDLIGFSAAFQLAGLISALWGVRDLDLARAVQGAVQWLLERESGGEAVRWTGMWK